METVSNAAVAAAKAVWGDPAATKHNESAGREPVSGKTGNPAAGEPYDAGNMEPIATPATETAPEASVTGSGVIEHESTRFAKNTGTAADGDDDSSHRNPSSALKERDEPSSAGQADVRDPEDPLTHPRAAPTDVDNTRPAATPPQGEDGEDEDAARLAAAQDKDLGPGPKPLEEVARERGGDAGGSATQKKQAGADGGDVEDAAGGEGQGGAKENLGTGEQHVKTTGFKADGGDFDASLPGAGREADRLQDQKGEGGSHSSTAAGAGAGASASDVSKKSTDNASPAPKSPSSSSSKEKKSLKDRIKNKLHRN